MELDEQLYTIMLNTEEIRYLCEALERGFKFAHEEHDVSILLTQADEGEMQVILNETGYDLVSHLQFGGVNSEKMWARVEE